MFGFFAYFLSFVIFLNVSTLALALLHSSLK